MDGVDARAWGRPGATIAGAALLQLASLVARSEAWHRCVRAAGGGVRRDQLYRVASVGYLGNIVNGELGFAIRVAALRRVAPERTPKLGVLAITEVPIVLVEAALAALVTFTFVGPLGLPWWLPIACFAVMAALALGLRRLALRRGLAGWWRGLSVLHDPGQRARMAVFVLLSMIAQILRNWILLRAVGVDASVFDATAVLVATAVLGLLPIGPSVGAGAFVLILGAHGVAGVAGAGCCWPEPARSARSRTPPGRSPTTSGTAALSSTDACPTTCARAARRRRRAAWAPPSPRFPPNGAASSRARTSAA